MLRTDSLIVLVAFVLSAAVYTPAVDGLTCYKCAWTDKDCATPALASNTKTEECGKGGGDKTTAAPAGNASAETTTAAAAAGATTAAGATAAAGATTAKPADVHTTVKTLTAGAKTYHCYKVNVKDDKGVTWVERGCTESNSTSSCTTIDKKEHPKAEVVSDSCKLCQTDKCNSGASVLGVSVQCALLSAALVAKLFCQTK